MVSDPDIVKEVMTDKETFPSRGPNGFDSMLEQGLVALETGKKWQRHRRAITQFLTDKHLKRFAVDIQVSRSPAHPQ
jgi:cytochrome P450